MLGFAMNVVSAGMIGVLSMVSLNETGEQVPAPTPANPSRDCRASLPVFGHFSGEYVAPKATMAMRNDGGWCSFMFTLIFEDVPSVPSVSVSVPPSHGHAEIKRTGRRFGVAYQPAPGFAGSDSFTVRTDGPFPHNIPVQVSVAG